MAIEGFDSFEEMMRHLRRDMDTADARVAAWQVAIKTGDYFRKPTNYGFQIYGEVLSEDEPRESGLEHYRFCHCYSVACPTGEMGDIHVSTIERLLTKLEFDEARRRNWQP